MDCVQPVVFLEVFCIAGHMLRPVGAGDCLRLGKPNPLVYAVECQVSLSSMGHPELLKDHSWSVNAVIADISSGILI